jgi:hypothetical protein
LRATVRPGHEEERGYGQGLWPADEPAVVAAIDPEMRKLLILGKQDSFLAVWYSGP